MKAERLAINSQCTFHWNLEEALDAYAAAGFRCVEPHLNLVKDWLDDGQDAYAPAGSRNVEPHLLTYVALGCGVMDLESRCMGTRGSRDEAGRR